MRSSTPLISKLVQIASVILLFSLLSPAPLITAQSTSGTLTGKVFDTASRPVTDAKVTVVNENNGNARATRTDATGTYTMPFLVPGTYAISASITGFDGGPVRAGIPLNFTTLLRAPDITLHPPSAPSTTPAQPAASAGAATQQDEITPLIVSTDATRRGNFTAKQIESLPLGGTTDMRTFDEFALLLPGVAPPPYTPGVRGPGVGFGIGSSGEFAVNGLRARSNNFTIDGSDNNDPDVGVRRQGFVVLVPQSIESIREFQISTLLWNSEMGRNIGSQVNAVSKEGGKKLHGQAYGFFTDSGLNAKNFFDYLGGASRGENPFTRTQAGVIITAPLVKDRTQFFGSFEHLKVNASIEQHFATPTLGERRFLGLPVFGVLKFSPNAFINEFFGERLGTTPVGRNILSFYPAPNNAGGPYGANTYTEVLPADGKGSVFSSKVTHRFDDGSTLYARYNFTDDARVLPSVNRAIRSTVIADTRTQDLSLIYDHEFGPRLFSQARFAYGRTRLEFSSHPDSPFVFSKSSLETVNTSTGSRVIPSTTGAIGELVVEPYSPVGVNAYSFPQERANNTFQFAESISWTLGRHAIRFGADIRRVQLNSLLDRNYRPQVVYGSAMLTTGTLRINSEPNNPFTFLPQNIGGFLSGVQLAALGLPSSIFQTITAGPSDSTIGLRFNEYNFFFNDNWRVRSNFAMDYGLRYEYNSVPKEVNNRIENALALTNLPAPGSSRADTPERTAAFNASVSAYRKVLDGRTGIYEPDRNNVGPHVGFAWDPWSDGKTSVRGGYGLFYDAILGAVVSQSRSVFPNEIPVNIEPAFTQFDVFTLNNPSTLVVRDGRGGVTIQDIPLIAKNTLNRFGGSPADFVALIGELLRQNQLGGGLAFTLPDKNLRSPYAQQWHLTLERELLRHYAVSLGYVGTRGTKLTLLTTPNLGPNVTPSIQFATNFANFPAGFALPPPLVLAECTRFQDNKKCSIQPNRPEPSLGAYQIFKNAASSNYHALQVEARSRYRHGYAFTVAYTWSHSIDDVSDVFPIAGAPTLPQNSFNLGLERASSNFDVRHRFATSLIWDLPFYRNAESGAAWRWFGGWQLASIFQSYTGQPFTLNLPNDANLDGNLTDRPSNTDGLLFSSGHGRQKVAIATGRTVADFFVLGRNGSVGRNTVRGDSFVNWDVALNKRFAFTESQRLDFRAEFFNALNRANFGIPIRTLGSPGFGSSVETANPARIVQFVLKYSF
ncbi:MAG: carboxypeptidase-like regulatory domain-containing protein [Acidobacteriota bacterium]